MREHERNIRPFFGHSYLLFVSLLFQDRPDSSAVDRATDAGHRAECAGRRWTCDPDEPRYFEVVGLYQRYLARCPQATGSVPSTIKSPPPIASGWLLPVPLSGWNRIVPSLVTGCVVRSLATTSSLRGDVGSTVCLPENRVFSGDWAVSLRRSMWHTTGGTVMGSTFVARRGG